MMKKVLSIALFSGFLTSAAVAEFDIFAGAAVNNSTTQIKANDNADFGDVGGLGATALLGAGMMMNNNFLGLEVGFGSGQKVAAFKYSYEFETFARYGYKFERFMPYLNAGMIMRTYKDNNMGSNIDNKNVVHFALGLGAETEIMKNVKMFGELNFILSGKKFTDDFGNEITMNYGTVLKVGARYYFPM